MLAPYAAAIALLLCSHFIKVLRWGLLTNSYNETRLSRLMSALSAGFAVNFVLPFRAGELVRAYMASRRSNSGFFFYLATVVLERLLDVVFVLALFAGIWLGGFAPSAGGIARGYALMLLAVCAAGALGRLLRRPLKRLWLWLMAVFNPHIQLQGLFFAYSAITLVKDFARRISKGWFLLLSLLMWGGYLASYYFFVAALDAAAPATSYMDLLTVLFGPGNLFVPQIVPIWRLAGGNLAVLALFTGYILSPLALMLFIGALLKSRAAALSAPLKRFFYRGGGANVLPIAEPASRLGFLRGYFSGERQSGYYEAYVEMNRDIYVLRDMVGGSDATTVQILKDGELRYRKYAFAAEGAGLQRQTAWMREWPDLPQARIIGQIENAAGFCYDMEYDPQAMDFFTYAHSTSADDAWAVLAAVLADLDEKLHAPTRRPANEANIRRYIDEKITANVERIAASPLFDEARRFESLEINGRVCPGLGAYMTRLADTEALAAIFAGDEEAAVHGDLTIENIVYAPGRPGRYYLIDPNPENIHNTPFIDYAKLLQSLHYGYEFLMKATAVEASGGKVRFSAMRSAAYDELLGRYRAWLAARFSPAGLRSLAWHEVTNVLRLLPYKMKRAPELAMLYYAGLLLLLADLEREGWL